MTALIMVQILYAAQGTKQATHQQQSFHFQEN
jgi:hypothetical protein